MGRLKDRKGKQSQRMYIGKKTWKRTKQNVFELEFVFRVCGEKIPDQFQVLDSISRIKISQDRTN